MDLALSIAIGSSVQVALFVAPVLVLASFFLGPTSMDLTFPRGAHPYGAPIGADHVSGRGRRTIRLAQRSPLLAVYLIFGLAFFFLPSPPPQ